MDLEQYKFTTDLPPKAGRILISEPTLPDEHFHRSVVFLCHHDLEGSMGFVLNSFMDEPLSFYLTELEEHPIVLHKGGPVGMDRLQFIHTQGDLLGGETILEDICLGGDFKEAISLLKKGIIKEEDIKFFLGYSGWETKQLEREILENSWLVADTNADFIFNSSQDDNLWTLAILKMDKSYHSLLHFPSDPSQN